MKPCVLLIAFCLIATAALADDPTYYTMQDKNLRAFEQVMDTVGYIVKAHDGRAYGSEAQRAEGTGFCVVRCKTDQGEWITLAVFSKKGIILRIRKYPAKSP